MDRSTAFRADGDNGRGRDSRCDLIQKDKPGRLCYLHKDLLQIHPAYQRDVIPGKIKEITAQWSWVSAGVIIVGERNGEFLVIDGQHRVVSAKRRGDIESLPCVVFKTVDVRQEAVAFLDVNAGRKPISSIGKFKAMLAAGDVDAKKVHEVFRRYGITPRSTPHGPGDIKSVAWSIKKARENAEKFEIVTRFSLEICNAAGIPVAEKILDGLWYINENANVSILDARLSDRIRSVGAKALIDAASKASVYFVKGGASVWATGMMGAINKGLRNRFTLRGELV